MLWGASTDNPDEGPYIETSNVILENRFFNMYVVNFLAVVTRDFAAGVNDPGVRATVLYPWQPESFVFDESVCKDYIDEILFPNEVKTSTAFRCYSLRE